MPPAKRKKVAATAPEPEREPGPGVRQPSPGESGDPAVHQLLAHRQSAELNNDEAAMAAVDQQLADLGY